MKMFVLYDGRARAGVIVDDITIFDTAESVAEIVKLQKDFPCLHPKDTLWYEYDVIDNCLKNGKARYDLDEKR